MSLPGLRTGERFANFYCTRVGTWIDCFLSICLICHLSSSLRKILYLLNVDNVYILHLHTFDF